MTNVEHKLGIYVYSVTFNISFSSFSPFTTFGQANDHKHRRITLSFMLHVGHAFTLMIFMSLNLIQDHILVLDSCQKSSWVRYGC